LLAAAGVLLLLHTADTAVARRSETVGWLRGATLALAALALAEAGCALADPAGPAPWLHRSAWVLAALVTLMFAYGDGLPRWLGEEHEWAEPARGSVAVLGGLALGAVGVVLLQQLLLYDPATRRTAMGGPAVAAVLAALVALAGTLIRFAVVPRNDPLGPSPGGRTAYVYLAEVLLALLFVHLRLNVPQLFSGLAAQYWTLIVMVLAFLGVGLSEYFERRGLPVLAVPLQRTGVLLPLLPLLVFWARPPAALLHFADASAPGLRPLLGYLDRLPWQFDAHALLWFLAGFLYALVAAARRSFRWALLSALAANCGVWALLAHHGVSFLVHPQAWLIPLGLIVLASEYVNRAQLRPEVAAGLRYLGVCVVYLASTADLLLAGVGNSVWLPVVLAALAVAGVLAGILLRVRAFLFTGVGFLLLDVLTMIWHAAVGREQAWVWWVSGIVLGAAILALFAVFEKRRDDVLRLVEAIKRWD
jgi:hypothetical protein